MHLWILAILFVCDEPEHLPAPQPTTGYHVLDLITETASRVLADLLIQADPWTPCPIAPVPVRLAVQDLALRRELIDHREFSYMFQRLEDWEVDLNLIRQRRNQFGNAPMVSDGERFPDMQTIRAYLDFNRQYRTVIDGRLVVLAESRKDELAPTLLECDRLYHTGRMPPWVPVWRFQEMR